MMIGITRSVESSTRKISYFPSPHIPKAAWISSRLQSFTHPQAIMIAVHSCSHINDHLFTPNYPPVEAPTDPPKPAEEPA